MQQLIQALCLDAHDCLRRRNLALIDQIAGNLDCRVCGALAVAGLEEVQLALLNGELHILHIAIMVFQLVRDFHKLCIALRQVLRKAGDRLRGADACDDVLALCVNEVLAKNALLTGGRVASERNTGSGGIAHVAEYHRLYVDRGAPVARDIVHAAVDDCARVVPRTEHRLDRLHQLYLRVLREFLAHLFGINRLVTRDDLLEIVRGQVGIILCALALLDLVQNALKEGLAHLHDDIREHLDKAAVGVVGKARIAGLFRKALDGYVIQTEVEDRVHHAGHGGTRARTDGYQQRIRFVAEALALLLLQLGQRLKNLRGDLVRDRLSLRIVIGTRFRRNREALRNRQTQIGHFGEIRALAAEQLTHVCTSFTEQINPFFHSIFLHK